MNPTEELTNLINQVCARRALFLDQATTLRRIIAEAAKRDPSVARALVAATLAVEGIPVSQ